MLKNRRSFTRLINQINYRKIYIISVEGNKTEPQYFERLNTKICTIKLLSHISNNAPLEVLQRMKIYIKKESLLSTDEAWLVIDKDEWTEDQLNRLFKWSKESNNYGLAVSNPNFEYWLLLHFEEGNDINNARDCLNRLKKHLPNYIKKLDLILINQEMMQNAIKRAKLRDKPPCLDWPRSNGVTTVYKLVEGILKLETR